MLVNAVTINNARSAVTGNIDNSQATAAAPLLANNLANNLENNTLRQATATLNAVAVNAPEQSSQSAERNSESVRVSSSIGRAASAGQLTREQALEIYRNIARFL